MSRVFGFTIGYFSVFLLLRRHDKKEVVARLLPLARYKVDAKTVQ